MSVTDYSRSTAKRLIGEATGAVAWNGVTISSNTPATAGYVIVATGSNSAQWLDKLSFGSNATDVSSVSAAGSHPSNSRADHVHRGVGSIVTNSSNTLYGTVGVTAGTGIAITTSAAGVVTVAAGGVSGLTHTSNTQTGNVTLTTPDNSLAVVEPSDGTFALYGPTLSHTSNTFFRTTLRTTGDNTIGITSPQAGIYELSGQSISTASNTLKGPVTLRADPSIGLTLPQAGILQISGQSIAVASNTLTGPITLTTPGNTISITRPTANVLAFQTTPAVQTQTTVTAASNTFSPGLTLTSPDQSIGITVPSAGIAALQGATFSHASNTFVRTTIRTPGHTIGVVNPSGAILDLYGPTLTHTSNTAFRTLLTTPGNSLSITEPTEGTLALQGQTIAHSSNSYTPSLTLRTDNSLGLTSPQAGILQLSGQSIAVASNTFNGPITLRTPRNQIAVVHAGGNILDLINDFTPGDSITGTIRVQSSAGSNFSSGTLSNSSGVVVLSTGETFPARVAMYSVNYANGALAGAMDIAGRPPSNAVLISGAPSFMSAQASTVTGTNNNLAVTNDTAVLRWAGASAATLTGLVKSNGGDGEPADGRTLFIQNASTSAILTLAHETNTSSSGNRFICPGNTDYTIAPGGGETIQYDVTSGRWRVLEGAPPTKASENFLGADVAMTLANTVYDGPSLSLTAGTYLLSGRIEIEGPAAAAYGNARLYSGTTILDEAEGYSPTLAIIPLAVFGTVTLTTTTTVKISGISGTAGCTIRTTNVSNGTANKASHLLALRIG